MHTNVLKLDSSCNRFHLQYSNSAIVHTKVINCSNASKKLSITVVQLKVIIWNSANKSCLLQLAHTEAIAASMQFCDFCLFGTYYTLSMTKESCDEILSISLLFHSFCFLLVDIFSAFT